MNDSEPAHGNRAPPALRKGACLREERQARKSLGERRNPGGHQKGDTAALAGARRAAHVARPGKIP